MKKFMFSLSRMLDYKEQLLEREKNILRQFNFRRDQLDDKIASLRRQSRMISHDMGELVREGTTAFEMSTCQFKLENIRRAIEQLILDRAVLTKDIDKQTRVVVLASQEVKGLEKLREKQHEEFVHEETRAAQEEMAEFISMKLVRESVLSRA